MIKKQIININNKNKHRTNSRSFYINRETVIWSRGEWRWCNRFNEGLSLLEDVPLTSSEKWKALLTVTTAYLVVVAYSWWWVELIWGFGNEEYLNPYLFNTHEPATVQLIENNQIIISNYSIKNWVLWTSEIFSQNKINFLEIMIFATIGYSFGFLGLIFSKKNLISLLVSIELLFVSITLMYGTAAVFLNLETMQQHALLIMLAAAAESSIGLALLILANQSYKTINTVKFSNLKN